jgi:Zn-dependent peptidase ImmA (M78 family)/transcriptional regulator with XRE-family HTH domain
MQPPASSREYAINPDMVIVARESRLMTQKELADSMQMTQGTVSKIEAGLRGVSDETLNRLVAVLEYPAAFFFQRDQLHGVGIGEIFHRKRQALPAKVQAAVQARMNVSRFQLARLLRAVELPECRIPNFDAEGFDGDPEDAAQRVRALWNLPRGPVDSVTTRIEDAGGVIVPCDFGTTQLDAMSQFIPGMPPIFFINIDVPTDRLRFTLAHELGHMILHQSPHMTVGPEIEDEAGRFGAEFLMPARDIRADLADVTLAKLAALKPYWKVSMQALLKRATDLSAITAQQGQSLWKQIAASGYRKREPIELDTATERPMLWRELLEAHRKQLGFSVAELASLLCTYQREVEAMVSPDGPRLRLVR